MVQVVWLHSPAMPDEPYWLFVAKPSGLDACKDGEIVHRIGTRASCHNGQGFKVDALIDEASTV